MRKQRETDEGNSDDQILFNFPPQEEQDLSSGSILFEQYKLYVVMTDETSNRRHDANTFFLAVNTFMITAIGAFVGLTQKSDIRYGWLLVGMIAGIILCIAWFRLLKSYRELNSGRFKVIHALEARLPARLYRAEWGYLKQGDGTVYTPFNKTEKIVPFVFVGLYIALAIGLIIDWTGVL